MIEKTRQAATVLAICASILLAGMIIAYKPGAIPDVSELLKTGMPPALGSTGLTAITTETPNNPKTLSVSGTAVINVKANQATVTLGVYTEAREASTAINENAAKMTAVVNALKQLGFKDEDMQTSNYNVYPNYNWEVRMVVSYQVTNMIQIKIKDLAKVGPAIDAASSAGANRVDSITFGITDETAQATKLQAYSGAIADAKAKSDVITSGLGIKIVGVQSVSESIYYPVINYKSYDSGAGATPAPTTPVLAGNLSVTVTLNIVYLIDANTA